MARRNNYRDGKVYVMAEMCATCVFRPGNLMDLQPGRLRYMVKKSLDDDAAITCHKTIDTDNNAVCRGFFDRHQRDVTPLRLAAHCGALAFQEPEE